MAQLPPLLEEIPDPPKKLFMRGAVPTTDVRFLAVVGSRTYSAYGRRVCEELIRGLRGYPVVIVSGLALGIDGIAHQAALDAGLTTVAVPGSGLDDRVLYPASHRSLARRILGSGGALVSEFEPMWRPRPESFPQRNRIMAGMSHAVLVIEATQRSGTLITSRLATEYNRDVLAVPGPVHAATSRGPHMLLKKGAALVETSMDILEALGIDPSSPETQLHSADLSDDERAVLALLTAPLPRQAVLEQLSLSTSQANVVLASLELKGVITERMGMVERVGAP
jgi:DNA processing protein